MIALWTASPRATHSLHPRAYRIAAQGLLSDARLAELAAFEVPYRGGLSSSSHFREASSSSGALLYRGPGWIGNRWRDVECRSVANGTQLDVSEVGSFLVSEDGSTLARIGDNQNGDAQSVVETLLGPVLILALALQGTWCLHASAVVFGGRAIAFLGESGSGKSTLAWFLGMEGGPAWRTLADDILPVAPGRGGLDAMPAFPQLKCPPEAQPSRGLPERVPLAAIYSLGDPASAPDRVDIRPLSARSATLGLVRHTVAAQLFGQDLLAQHLDFAADAAAHVPMRHLTYPREVRALPAVRDALAADLGTV